MQAVVAPDNHDVENVVLEAADAKARADLQVFWANAGLAADRFAEGGNAVERTTAQGQKGVCLELAELAAPQIGSQDALVRHPLAL